MKIATIMLNAKEWEEFHSEDDPDLVFFAITTALQRIGDQNPNLPAGSNIDPANIPAIAHGAIVFHQAWQAFEGRYTTNNDFHGYTRDGYSKPGFLANVRAMSAFMAMLGARDWVDALADTIDAAEATPAALWGMQREGGIFSFYNLSAQTEARRAAIFQGERMTGLASLDILKQAAGYVQQHCPVARAG
jgi:hypothetical protein